MKLNRIYLTVKVLLVAVIFSFIFVYDEGNSYANEARFHEEVLSEFLNYFYDSSQSAVDWLPRKYSFDEVSELSANHSFSSQNVDATHAETMEEHDQVRQWIAAGSSNGSISAFAPFLGNNHVESLVDGVIIRNLRTLEHNGLLRARVRVLPWGDYYWPIIKGGISNRYADPKFPKAREWATNYNYVSSHSAAHISNSRNWMSLNNLSPAEKYDLLVGDTSYGLTRWAWEQGRGYLEDRGHVPGWMGICHGWSVASYMTTTPEKFVDAPTADGRLLIRFYLSDLKALMSSLWARAMPHTRFVGGRCRTANPARDSRGRIRDPKCFDVNPGTWHLVVTNQIGKNRKSFVMDATFDYEVWNQPVVSYSYTYFNPESRVSTPRLDQAMIPVSEFYRDKYRGYRSAEAHNIVGINMHVTYAVEMTANHNHKHLAPRTRTVNYVYDLELDANDQVIGGEWYQKAHPDFLWTVSDDAVPMSVGEELIPRNAIWVGNSPLPHTWLDAVRASSARGQPLTQIIYALFSRAQNGMKLRRGAPNSASENSENP